MQLLRRSLAGDDIVYGVVRVCRILTYGTTEVGEYNARRTAGGRPKPDGPESLPKRSQIDAVCQAKEDKECEAV